MVNKVEFSLNTVVFSVNNVNKDLLELYFFVFFKLIPDALG